MNNSKFPPIEPLLKITPKKIHPLLHALFKGEEVAYLKMVTVSKKFQLILTEFSLKEAYLEGVSEGLDLLILKGRKVRTDSSGEILNSSEGVEDITLSSNLLELTTEFKIKEDYSDSIDPKEVAEGKMDGEIVWVCDFRYDNYGEKPIRKILPTKVMVRSNSESIRTFYYSESHFARLSKKGEPLKSKLIALVDNTGYRNRSGQPLWIFPDEKSCVHQFNLLVDAAKEGMKNYIKKKELDLKEISNLRIQ